MQSDDYDIVDVNENLAKSLTFGQRSPMPLPVLVVGIHRASSYLSWLPDVYLLYSLFGDELWPIHLFC